MITGTLVPAFLLLLACGDDDERTFGTGGTTDTGDSAGDSGESAETAESTESGDDSGIWDTDPWGGGDTSLDNGGGGEDTVNATWVRCESEGASWTFHTELNYAARGVTVDVAKGTSGYEVWYLQVQDEGRTLWETTVEGRSGHNCEETLDLLWTIEGSTGWVVHYESQYTPP